MFNLRVYPSISRFPAIHFPNFRNYPKIQIPEIPRHSIRPWPSIDSASAVALFLAASKGLARGGSHTSPTDQLCIIAASTHPSKLCSPASEPQPSPADRFFLRSCAALPASPSTAASDSKVRPPSIPFVASDLFVALTPSKILQSILHRRAHSYETEHRYARLCTYSVYRRFNFTATCE